MQSYSVNNAWIADNVYYDGSFKLRSNGYASQIYFGTSNGGADISFKRYPTGNAGDVRTAVTSLQLLGNGDVYIPGNVGIGITNPGAQLDIVGPSGGSAILKLQRNGVGAYQYFVTDIGSGAQQLFCDAQQTDSGFVFRTRNSSNTVVPALYIAPSGNIGVFTTTPSTKLDVHGTTGTRNRNTTSGETSSVFETSRYYGVAGNATTNISIDTSVAFPPMASGGYILVEVSASGYGSGGTNGLIFSYITGGYGGHYAALNQPYHPVTIIVNTMQNGTCTWYNPDPTTIGITIANGSSTGVTGVMRVKVTTTY